MISFDFNSFLNLQRVLESKNPSFPEGAKIFGQFGWRTHNVVNPTEIQKKKFIDCYQLPEFQGHPTSLGLGLLGMPGNTAHFGMKEILKPEDGETIVITGAAGAVGTIVGQLAKLKGCRVVGFAGSEEKCRWLENEYDFDKAINYKTPDLAKQLKDATPQRVDMYFDNVGGEISSLIYGRMKDYGRIAVCGAIDSYNHDKPNLHAVQKFFVAKQLKLEGFLVWRWSDRWLEGLNELATLLKEGKLKYHETITEGFENTPQAFIEMLRGKNYGKAIVKV